uniref:Uncharacterized protein n=1 Tax=Magallana gigas TaxID=29159 RepID=K1PHR3_MAGGI
MRESVQRRFALDLKLRCRTEYENCFKHFPSDLITFDEMSHVNSVLSIISCYQGQGGKSCQLHSFPCRRLKNNKWNSSVFPRDFELNMTEEDIWLLKDCINLTLGLIESFIITSVG